MAEKRRLSARERREPAAKRRVSEAAPATQSSKKKASIPTAAPSPTPAPAPEPEPQVVEKPLPTKIKDGEGLPTLSSPQSETLSDKDYQSIAESAVLLASLERSKKKWLSDGILVRYWTKPKKTKREQIEGKNPPKESMSKVGPCNIVVGPHLFDAMLYTVKDPNAPPPIQYTPPQRPMVHYGHPNNFQQYHPYPAPAPPQHGRQHPPQTTPTHAPSPRPGHQPNSHPPPPPNRTPNHSTPRPAPPPPGPGPQSAQRPSPSQQPQPPQPAKPSPDPVIQMLATRAASDPDLKALMRVVASSKASQEQLRAFQAHIDELNAIIRAREQQQQRQQQQLQQSTPGQSQASPRTPQPTPQQQAPQPQSSQKPPQSAHQSGQQAGPQAPQDPPLQQKQSTPKSQPTPSQAQDQSYPRVEVQIPSPSSSRVTPSKAPQTHNAQNPGSTPQVKQEPSTTGQPLSVEPSPAVRPMPPPQQTPGAPPPSGPQHPSHQHQQQQPHQGHPPAIQSRPPQYGSPTPYYRPAPPPPPPRMNFKSVVFEFTSPLTPYGSSTSGHAGSGDRYLFPEYTILEWLPGGNTVLASFLLVKKVDPNLPFPIETAPDAGSTRAKGKSGSRSKKSDKKKAKDKEKEEKEEKGEKEKEKDKKEESKTAEEKDKSNAQSASTPQDPSSTESKQPATGDKTAVEQNQQKDQASATPSKADSGKQPAKDKSEDAKDNFILKEYYQPVTFRIHSTNPKVLEPLNRVVKPADEVRKYMNEVMDRAERAPDGFLAYRLPREEIPEEPEVEETKKSGTPVPVSTGRKPSRGKAAVDESDVENSEFVEEPDEEEEEELKDFYGAPTGLLPMAPM